jgi:hypothetical protein
MKSNSCVRDESRLAAGMCKVLQHEILKQVRNGWYALRPDCRGVSGWIAPLRIYVVDGDSCA